MENTDLNFRTKCAEGKHQGDEIGKLLQIDLQLNSSPNKVRVIRKKWIYSIYWEMGEVYIKFPLENAREKKHGTSSFI
jgi:hypothetical protein